MRITGGKARGIQITAPKGNRTRPATDRMREAVFSSLGPAIEDCVVADLFAGTGSYGLEALSRGARSCNFYENDSAALDCLRANAEAVRRSAGIKANGFRIERGDLFKSALPESVFNLIFMDPPYDRIEAELPDIFAKVVERIATPDAVVLVELPGNLEPKISEWTLARRIGKSGKDKPTVARYERELKAR